MLRLLLFNNRLGCQSGRSAAGLAFASVMSPAVAGSASWAHQAGSLSSNGSVTVKSLAGGSYAAAQNPTGAVAKASQNAATQPPTVIVQATASLPIKTIGEACTAMTSGASPNQTADEGTAITADRSSLLTCQGGVWGKQVDSVPKGTLCGYNDGAASTSCMGYTPPSCPPGYSVFASGNAGWRCVKT